MPCVPLICILGMADVAALTGDSAYIHAIDRIWDNIVGKKYYITAWHRGDQQRRGFRQKL